MVVVAERVPASDNAVVAGELIAQSILFSTQTAAAVDEAVVTTAHAAAVVLRWLSSV